MDISNYISYDGVPSSDWSDIRVDFYIGDELSYSEIPTKGSIPSSLYNSFIPRYQSSEFFSTSDKNYNGFLEYVNDEDILVYTQDSLLIIRLLGISTLLSVDDSDKEPYTKIIIVDIASDLEKNVITIDFTNYQNPIINDSLIVISMTSEDTVSYSDIHIDNEGFEHSEVAINPRDISDNNYPSESTIVNHTDITNFQLSGLKVISDKLITHYLGTTYKLDDSESLLLEDNEYILLEGSSFSNNTLLISSGTDMSYYGYTLYDITDGTIELNNLDYEITVEDDNTATATRLGYNTLYGKVNDDKTIFGQGTFLGNVRVHPTERYPIVNNKVTIENVEFEVTNILDSTCILYNAFYNSVSGNISDDSEFYILDTTELPDFENTPDVTIPTTYGD